MSIEVLKFRPRDHRQKEDDSMKTIGEKIRECRIRLNLTQADLSEKTGSLYVQFPSMKRILSRLVA